MINLAADLARRLAREAEAVCRHYLANGRRQGRHWIVGDVFNTPGRSLYVRLHGPQFGSGAAGKWTDAATGQHGDLLDLIGLNRGLISVREIMDEARLFLALPPPSAPSWRRSTTSTSAKKRRSGSIFALPFLIVWFSPSAPSTRTMASKGAR